MQLYSLGFFSKQTVWQKIKKKPTVHRKVAKL